jgi:DNA repair protein RecN (Recombination protein N)
MLTHLRISNFALLEQIEIDFEGGLSLLTGETGAGKSILIDAICRLLGARATQDDVRSGASKAILEAIFEASRLPLSARNLLQDWNIELDEDDCIVRREITSSGKSRAMINQCTVTIGQLKQFAPYLIDVFGQNEHQTLLDESSQRMLFDEAAGLQKSVSELASISSSISSIQQEWKSIMQQEQQRQRNIDILQYQIREIEDASVSENEEEALQAKRSLLQNSEKINLICESLLQEILESDENLLGRIENVGKQLSELKNFQEPLSAYVTKCIEWLDELNELARKIDGMRRNLDFEEGSLDKIEARLDQLQRLKKKYGPTLKDVLDHLTHSKQELNNNFQAEWRADQMIEAVRKYAGEYRKLASEISVAREKFRSSFQKKVEAELKQVAMEKCSFRVMLQPVESSGVDGQDLMEASFPAHGLEEVFFQIEPNPGEGFRDLSRIASGGELSRLMLALKVVTQAHAGQCLIFDEIDAGVGGRVAFQIGERLKRLSGAAQVLCVTHLPQVAAFGSSHFRVSKSVKDHRTITIVERLPENERIQELARMISGSEVTETALRHARELRGQVEAGVG